jgi:hypothetical protein
MSALGGKADMRWVVHAATEELQYSVYLCAIHKPAGPAEPRGNIFLGAEGRGFIERWFGFSGGRGDGSLEVLSLVVLGMIFLIVMMRFVRK